MAFTLSRIDRKTRTYELSATVLAEAAAIPPDLTGVDVALLPPRGAPTAATVWFSADYDDGSFTVLLAGPDADSTGAVVVPASADIWMRIADAPEVDAEKLERIIVLGGGTPLLPATGVPVVSVNGKTGTAVVLTASDVGAATPSDLTTGLATKVNTSTYTAGLAAKQDVSTLGATVAADATVNATFVPREGAVLADWPTPFEQAHRAAANVYPEDTLPAIRAMVNQGVCVGVNALATSDGALAVIHDLTLDRTTTGTGTVASKTRAQIEALSTDASTWFGQNWGSQRILFLEEVLNEVGRKVPLMVEPMTDASVPAVVAMIQRHGLTDTTAIFYGVAALLKDVYANTGIRTYLGGTDGTAAVSVLTSNGITGIALNADQVSKAQVDVYIAAGIDVEIHTITRQTNKDKFAGSAITQWASDDPLYTSGNVAAYRRVKDPFAMQQWYHGMVPSLNSQFQNATVGDFAGYNGPEVTIPANNRGFFVAPNRWGMGNSGHTLQGWGCPIQWASSSYTIEFDMTFDLVGADTTRYGTIFFCHTNDYSYHNQTARATDNGYLFMMRSNGTMELVKVTAGTGTLTTTAATTAITTGGVVHLKVTVTPTAVTVQRDGGTTVTITDATHRGGYFHFGMATGTPNADRRSWSNVVIAPA